MTRQKNENKPADPKSREKILLAMLPYWTALVPPQGIAHLKTFLQRHHYSVKTKDANTADEFKKYYSEYFDLLKEYIPANKQGNFYNIGHDVLRNHMMAHIHYKNKKEYIELVKVIVYQTYFTPFKDSQVERLNKILENFYTELEIYMSALVEKEKPGWLGLSVLRDTIGPSLFAFRLVREKFPHIRTIMGGSIFSDHLLPGSPNFEDFLKRTPYIDKIIIGEGQNLFLKLLEEELPPSQRVFTLKDIGGQTLGFSAANCPDMSDFNVVQDYPYLSAQASASCPNRCSFCNVPSFYGKYREKDPKQAVQEMIKLYETYGMQVFYMNDALLNLVASPLSEEFIESGVSLYWDGYLRVGDPVCDMENTFLWRRGGMYRVRLGVESGSQHVLDLIGKGITPDQTAASLQSLANAGIKTTTYWVIGHPGETEADFLLTLEKLAEWKNYIYEAECNPFIFGYTGQSSSSAWENKRKLLYPQGAEEMLLLRTWIVAAEPSREEVYSRVNRFVGRCKELGIPNPYSQLDIYEADKRWKMLHKNAVPALAEFRDEGAYIDDTKQVKNLYFLKNPLQEDEGDFDF
ncbi:MAG: radical SAM protein [Candidatus Aminicenantes bacterium]|nr:radical SAM protein [Candidatus Aminicenantes bacterium]